MFLSPVSETSYTRVTLIIGNRKHIFASCFSSDTMQLAVEYCLFFSSSCFAAKVPYQNSVPK